MKESIMQEMQIVKESTEMMHMASGNSRIIDMTAYLNSACPFFEVVENISVHEF